MANKIIVDNEGFSQLCFLLIVRLRSWSFVDSFLFISFIDLPIHVQVLYFVDDNGNEVLSLGSMVKVSEDTIRIILCRDSLEADEFVKFQVSAVQTCRRCVTRPRLFIFTLVEATSKTQSPRNQQNSPSLNTLAMNQ